MKFFTDKLMSKTIPSEENWDTDESDNEARTAQATQSPQKPQPTFHNIPANSIKD